VSAVDVAAYATRTLIIVVLLIVAFRLFGKREAGQLTVYDLVAIVAVANAVQNAMTGGQGALWVGLATSSVIIVITWVVVRVGVRHPLLERLALGIPTIVVNDGRVLTDRLRREHLSRADLDAAIRGHGLDSAADVRLAVLEIDGSISVVPR
jgi:uncharacterized membrane protein YcaP (DUF421 family)